MENSVFDQIKVAMPSLSAKQKLVADLILKDETVFLKNTLRDLESKLGVSKSAIVRLSQSLGYEKYADFKAALWKDAEKRKSPFARFTAFLDQGEDCIDDAFVRISEDAITNISNTMGHMSQGDCQKIVEAIDGSRRVIVLGLGISSFLAQITAYLLNRVAVNAVALSQNSLTLCEQIVNFNKDDLVIAFSFQPYSPMTVQAVGFAAQRGHRVVLFTDTFSSPACKYSEDIVITDVDSIAMANAIMAPLTVVYAITFQLGMARKELTMKNSRCLSDLPLP